MRQQAIAIMHNSFDDNPAVGFSIGRGWGYGFRKKRLAAFMYDYCSRRHGVYFSSEGNGLICYYFSDAKVPWFLNLWDELCVGLLAIGPIRMWKVLRRSRLIAAKQKDFPPHIHCWYLGVHSEHRHFREAAELRNTLFETAHRTHRLILAETTIPQNKRVYERMGFVTYDEVEADGLKTFLMKK